VTAADMEPKPEFTLTDRQMLMRARLGSTAKNILAYGGSRSGKTFGFCYAIAARALMARESRHAIFRRHGVTAKQAIAQDTFPKMMGLAFPGVDYDWKAQDGYFKFRNGSEIWVSGLDDKKRVEKILGKEYATIYFNEASEIPYDSYIMAKSRLAQKCTKQVSRYRRLPLKQKTYVDLNPTTNTHWTYKLWIDNVDPVTDLPVDKNLYSYILMNPKHNLENLTPEYINELKSFPPMQRKRFYEGKFSSDVPNALWTRDKINHIAEKPEDLAQVIVSIDPAVTNTIGSDETGIVVCAVGLGKNPKGYVLDDVSGRYRPEEWARLAVEYYDLYDADCIVAEVNQGGDMVERNIRTIRPNIPFRSVRATRGKSVRAAPIAALYHQKRIFHVGEFPTLENQLCSVTIDFDSKEAGWSPDRVDALVWGFSELFGVMTRQKKKIQEVKVVPRAIPMARAGI